jgi:hypothetical protein
MKGGSRNAHLTAIEQTICLLGTQALKLSSAPLAWDIRHGNVDGRLLLALDVGVRATVLVDDRGRLAAVADEGKRVARTRCSETLCKTNEALGARSIQASLP